MKHWLVKQEPEKYSFDDLIADGKTDWTGVRNFQARNNLREMRLKDKILFYHTVSEKAVVGAAEVLRENFPDEGDEKWIAVEIKPLEKFAKPVTLDAHQSAPRFAKHRPCKAITAFRDAFDTIGI